MKEELMDEFKEFFFMNSPWLVGAYYLLALAEFLLKMAFIKSEFMFWKNIDQNKGVSLKTLFFELGAKIIFILYLYEYKSSKIILFFDSLDLLITLWKISRTFCLKLTPGFPFLRLATSDVYKQREAIDNQSIWYMNYLLLPLMGCYLTYALYTRGARVTHWYRFALDTTVAFIGIFGFILMTPQLYINYKLKSVDHLNWRGLIYRFVTTIIDDLFAFMITMPPLRRLLYFRDGNGPIMQTSSSSSTSTRDRSTRPTFPGKRSSPSKTQLSPSSRSDAIESMRVAFIISPSHLRSIILVIQSHEPRDSISSSCHRSNASLHLQGHPHPPPPTITPAQTGRSLPTSQPVQTQTAIPRTQLQTAPAARADEVQLQKHVL
jgi:hypothetical protein